MPHHSVLAGELPANASEWRNITCERSYAIHGEPGNVVQHVKCIELGLWAFSNHSDCERKHTIVIGYEFSN